MNQIQINASTLGSTLGLSFVPAYGIFNDDFGQLQIIKSTQDFGFKRHD